jgi:DNA-binding PadR family transcriptional regulator
MFNFALCRGRCYVSDDTRFTGGVLREDGGKLFQRCDLKYILWLIKAKPRDGYEIIRASKPSLRLLQAEPRRDYPTLQMLEEMGYTRAAEQEGKKVYSITPEGLEFLAKKKDIADGVRSQVKHRWSFKNAGRMATVMREYHNLENLLGRGIFKLDADRSERIRQSSAALMRKSRRNWRINLMVKSPLGRERYQSRL